MLILAQTGHVALEVLEPESGKAVGLLAALALRARCTSRGTVATLVRAVVAIRAVVAAVACAAVAVASRSSGGVGREGPVKRSKLASVHGSGGRRPIAELGARTLDALPLALQLGLALLLLWRRGRNEVGDGGSGRSVDTCGRLDGRRATVGRACTGGTSRGWIRRRAAGCCA